MQPIPKTILFANIAHTANLGDRLCNPMLYFDASPRSRMGDIRSYGGEAVVFGGGGLLHPGIDAIIKSALNSGIHPKIVWGVGSNYHRTSEILHPSWLEHFDAVGLRDYANAWDYVPCPTCMHPAFDEVHPAPSHPAVIYQHHLLPIRLDGDPSFPRMSNLYASGDAALFGMAQVLRFLSSGVVVITNSYHGAYWSMLLGKRVVCWKPIANRFYGFKYPPRFCDEHDWCNQMKLSTSPPDDYISDCRELNLRFANRVRAIMSAWRLL